MAAANQLATSRCRVPRAHRGARGRDRSAAARARRLPGPAVFLLLLGCGRTATPAALPTPEVAAGVVLLVDGLPLVADEVEPLCGDIAALYPEYSRLHARRLALTNEFLPRLAAHAMEPERWQRARAECEALSDPRALEARNPTRSEGHFRALGLALWSAARHLPVGEWSAPLELTGRWLRLRLDERVSAPDPLYENLRISVVEFPYLEPEGAAASIQAAIDRAHLTLIDPAFAEAVPEAWKHRMRGSP